MEENAAANAVLLRMVDGIGEYVVVGKKSVTCERVQRILDDGSENSWDVGKNGMFGTDVPENSIYTFVMSGEGSRGR